DFRKKLEAHRAWILEDDKYGSDEKKRPGKPKTHEELFGLEVATGSECSVKSDCRACEKIEESYWQADGLMDQISDRFEINLDDTDDDENEDIETWQEEYSEEGNATTDLCSLQGVSALPLSP
ncbi:hypothetical protein L9F63_014510, partial [Diploptera punctata]